MTKDTIDRFLDEFKALFGKDMNSYKRYLKWLRSQLVILDEMGKFAIDMVHIKQLHDPDEKMYEIRSNRSKSNPRVIFTYLDDKSLLLTAVLEKDSSDVDISCDKEKNRLQILRKERKI